MKLSLLLAEEDINLRAAAELIECDMALAAAVMKAVNSSLYGLKGRVQSAQQAITYLGMREVAAITFEMGLRAAFPPAPELEPLWERAARRGLLMGRLAQRLGLDAWAADHYRAMLRAAATDTELAMLEHAGFGVSHDALGAALCESWGLAAPAVASVRHHVRVQAGGPLPEAADRRPVCAMSVVVHALMTDAAQLEASVERVAHEAGLDRVGLLRAARQVQEQLEAALAYGR